MSGIWTDQDKKLPGAYINIRTNEPLSIAPGERGTVVILQEMTKGTDKTIYTITAENQAWPEEATAEDKLLAKEALKNAQTVLVYKLPTTHDTDDVNEALAVLKTVHFNTLCYPYDGSTPSTAEANKAAVVTWIKAMRDDEGVKCQAVLANHDADSEAIINVVQGIVLSDGLTLTPAQVTAWAAGITAGASITTSNTGAKYVGAIDVADRMTKSEMEAAVDDGKFIFKVDSAQNVTVVYDINSLTAITEEKGKIYKKNRVIRTIDNIANDISNIFESNYVGKINNTEDGRSLLKGALADYFATLQSMNAIQNFNPDDITISAGNDSDAVVITVAIQIVDSVEKLYITVNLS